MQTRRLQAARIADVAVAAEILRRGGLVAFPTETVYGLGALALDPLAARAIYAAKGRPSSNPLIVHVTDEAAARALVTAWPAEAAALARAFWPGPLTLVLSRGAQIPDEVTGGGPTVAVRVPAHPAAQALLAAVGAPLAAPSANRSEHVSPTTAAHVLADLHGRIEAVLDGGPCALGIESTVVSLSGDTPRLLRAGAIERAALERVVGKLATGADTHAAADAATPSPGMSKRHYAPAGLVRLAARRDVASAALALIGDAHARVGVVWRKSAARALPLDTPVFTLPAEPAGYARALYATLRALEEAGCAALVLEDVPDGPAWEAIRDRLHRAAAREE